MNVSIPPTHIELPGLALIVMVGGAVEFTVMVMALLVAVVGLAQDTVLVSTQVITSPLTKVPLTYVLLVAPEILVPFFFHW